MGKRRANHPPVARPRKCAVRVEQSGEDLVLQRWRGNLITGGFLFLWLIGALNLAAFVGIAAFLLNVAGAFIYLLQDRQIRHKRPGRFFHRLPPLETLDGFGRLQRAPSTARPISGKEVGSATVSPKHPPGFYGTADTKRALNLSAAIEDLKPVESLPADTVRETLTSGREIDLRPLLLTVALLLALADLVIAYTLRGFLRRRPARFAAPSSCASFRR